MTRRSMVLTVATTLLATVVHCEPVRWFNLEVNDVRDETEVRLHLPMPLVLGVLDSVELEELHRGKLHVCAHSDDVDWPALLAKVRTAPELQPVTVSHRDTDVVVRKVGAVVEMRVNPLESGSQEAKVRLAAHLLDALEVDDEGELDLGVLAARLGDTKGEVLTVDSEDANVRIWVE